MKKNQYKVNFKCIHKCIKHAIIKKKNKNLGEEKKKDKKLEI